MSINKVRTNFVRRPIPKNGPFKTDNYNAAQDEMHNDLTDLAARWNTEAYPILNSLPRGSDEDRWSEASNIPDPLTDGLDGANLFADLDSTSSTDEGLFWNSTDSRPMTIKEVDQALFDRIDTVQEELQESIADVSNGLSTDQWTRLGTWVRDETASASNSVDGKATEAKTKVNTLLSDVFDNPTDSGSLSNTIQAMVNALLELHGGDWSDDITLSHSGIDEVPQDGVTNSAIYEHRARGSAITTLEHDLNRLRYEIARSRFGSDLGTGGKDWDVDVTDPVGSGIASLEEHIGYTGAGSQTSSNPHGITLENARTAGATFSGNVSMGSSRLTTLADPVDDNDATNKAWVISQIASSSAERVEYHFAGHTNVNTAIRWNHNKGIIYPVIQVIDKGVGGDYGVAVDEVYTYEQEHGIVNTDAFVSIEYIDANTVDVYTNVVNGVIVAVF